MTHTGSSSAFFASATLIFSMVICRSARSSLSPRRLALTERGTPGTESSAEREWTYWDHDSTWQLCAFRQDHREICHCRHGQYSTAWKVGTGRKTARQHDLAMFKADQ